MTDKKVVSGYISKEAQKVLASEAKRRGFRSPTAFISAILEGWVAHFQLRRRSNGKESAQKKSDM